MADVDLLREAAALMRERAEAATPGPWESGLVGVYSADPPRGAGLYVAHWEGKTETPQMNDRVHIASWHPAVALAVAKAIDDVVQAWEIADGWARDLDDDLIPFEDTVDGGWLAVARAYLGRDS